MRERIRRRRPSGRLAWMAASAAAAAATILTPSFTFCWTDAFVLSSSSSFTSSTTLLASSSTLSTFSTTSLQAHRPNKRPPPRREASSKQAVVSNKNQRSPFRRRDDIINNNKMGWEATVQKQESLHNNISNKNDIRRQFRSRVALYEEERLHGRQQQATDNESNNNRHLNKSKPTCQKEQARLSLQIHSMLSSDDDDDDDYDTEESFLATEEIADAKAVRAKLSDLDKSQAAFAVSKSLKPPPQVESLVEPLSQINVTTTFKQQQGRKRRRRMISRIHETGHDTIQQQYVKSMGQHQVLSAQDEVVLAREIQLLQKWEEQRQTLEETLLRAPTFQEWADAMDISVVDLKKQIRRSQQAKAALVEANLRLVVTVARQSVRRGRTDINFQDACQEGILGLTRATEKFDPNKGFRFSSYAVWWIKKKIHQSVTDQSRPVRLPPNVIRKINDIRIHEKVLQDELGRKPYDDEVAGKVGMTVEQLEFYRKSANQVISLDKKVKFNKQSDNSSNDPSLHALVKDPDQSPSEVAQSKSLREDVQRLIRTTLSPREQAVIRMRFGLDNGSTKTLQQIGDTFKVDREVIRKIEAKALRKLRQPHRNQSLKSYIADL